jgi:hypothetical protein
MADKPLRRLLDHLRRHAYAGGPESDRASAAGWLHDVAYRLALMARTAGRRPAPLPYRRWSEADPAARAADRVLCELLDAELRRRPARCRSSRNLSNG